MRSFKSLMSVVSLPTIVAMMSLLPWAVGANARPPGSPEGAGRVAGSARKEGARRAAVHGGRDADLRVSRGFRVDRERGGKGAGRADAYGIVARFVAESSCS